MAGFRDISGILADYEEPFFLDFMHVDEKASLTYLKLVKRLGRYPKNPTFLLRNMFSLRAYYGIT